MTKRNFKSSEVNEKPFHILLLVRDVVCSCESKIEIEIERF